jgi:hypothetical protein
MTKSEILASFQSVRDETSDSSPVVSLSRRAFNRALLKLKVWQQC